MTSFTAGIVIEVCMNRGFAVWMLAIAIGVGLRLVVWRLFVALKKQERAETIEAYDHAFGEAFAQACKERGIVLEQPLRLQVSAREASNG
jgi:hypothetical protein